MFTFRKNNKSNSLIALALARNGFFLEKEKFASGVHDYLFPVGTTNYYKRISEGEEEYDEFIAFLRSSNILETKFTSKSSQTMLIKALKRVMLYALLNTNFFGAKDTKLIRNNLSYLDRFIAGCLPSGGWSSAVPYEMARLYKSKLNYLTPANKRKVFDLFQQSIITRGGIEEAPGRIYLLENQMNEFLRFISQTEDLSSLYSL